MLKQLSVLLGALVLGSQLAAAELKPFSASYSANWKALPFSGKAERSLTRQGQDWQLTFNASAVVAGISETSLFSYQQEQIKPLSYQHKRSGLGKRRNNRQTYDYQQSTLHLSKLKGQPVTADIVPGALDQFSAQFALQLDVARGLREMSYQVQEGANIDEYRFRVLGQEQIKTAAGRFLATKVERLRDGNNKRQTVLWFANDWDFMLVQLLQVEPDGKEYLINLKSGQLDGKQIRGQ